MEFTNLLMRFSEIVGTVAFAISGAMVAVRYRLDLFGVLLLGGVTALGGGTLRDLLMGSVPPRMFSSFEYLLIAAITSFVVFTLAYFARGKEWKRPSALGEMLNVIDALGLGAFAVAGTQMPMLGGYTDNPFMCVFLGMTTGVGGGILRDLMIRDIPAVLRKDVYAVAAIIGSAVYYLLARCMGANSGVPTLAGIAVTVAIRVLASRYRWNLPRIRFPQDLY